MKLSKSQKRPLVLWNGEHLSRLRLLFTAYDTEIMHVDL